MKPARLLALVICALVVAGGLTGCSASTSASTRATASDSGPARVGTGEFAAVIEQPGTQIIDVRTPEEFADGHIAGAVNIPVQQPDFATRIAALDPNTTYAVYCRSGNRSQPAVAAMEEAGITTIYELDSGTKGWTAAGQPLTR
ncbi:MAG: rhodanese-like domain-containing protein [Mycobacterium sp.]|nr:rhodanese-like domain-containing protein [Mycobacterium sp.]